MRRISSAWSGVLVSLALVAGSPQALAAAPRMTPAVDAGQQANAIQTVDHRRWRHGSRHNRFRGDRFSFGFGFGFPLGYQPYAYRPQPYAYRAARCPYGYWYDPAYGCITTYDRPYAGSWRDLEYREN